MFLTSPQHPKRALHLSGLLLAAALLLAAPGRAQQGAVKVTPEAARGYAALAASVSPVRLSQTVAALSGIQYRVPGQPAGAAVTAHSRVAGTPGGALALAYVRRQFQAVFGAGHVAEEPFRVTAPADDGAALRGAGLPGPLALQPLWPDQVRTSTLPARGLDGPLIYAGRGDLAAFRGRPVQGSVVLLDFDCGTAWLNAARLGAAAVLFAAPAQAPRGEAEAKFAGVPLALPRFWVARADADALRAAARRSPGLRVHLSCDNPWRTAMTANVVGTIPGTGPLAAQTVVIESYYDSMSVVPTQAPGAESADGLAALLEIARAFKAHPPRRTAVFVACGAHFLGLQGARAYVDRHLDDWRPVSGFDALRHRLFGAPLPARTNVLLFTGLDLSSRAGTVGVFYKGDFYDCREDIQGGFSDIGHTFGENARKIGQTLGLDPAAFADGINGAGGRTWRDYLPGRFAFDAEAATMAGGKGVTLATTDDARVTADTPFDTPDRVDLANLAAQTRLLACEYWDVLNDSNDPDRVGPDSAASLMPVPGWPAWTRQGLQLGFSSLEGRVLLFDPRRNFVPDEPVADSLAVVDNPAKTMTGVRGALIQATEGGPRGASFRFAGLPLVISNGGSGGGGLRYAPDWRLHLGAYHLHAADDAAGARGDVDYAPDLGVNGAANYPISLDLTGSDTRTQIIVFPCVATSLYDLIDQQTLTALPGIHVYDGASDGEPRQYGFVLSGADPGTAAADAAVLFSTPGPQTRLKVVMDDGPGSAARLLLINALPPDPHRSAAENRRDAQGVGYALGRGGAVTDTALRSAQDMWTLDDFRISGLAKFRIVQPHDRSDPLTRLHDQAGAEIRRARAAYAARDYAAYDTQSRQAWADECRVYPQAQQVAADVVQGVIFYLFLLIPFSYFLERLLFGHADLRRQIGAAFGIFLVTFLILSQIHPAFSVGSVNPLIILIAFVMLALSVIVSLVVWNKFEGQVQQGGRAALGAHKADAGRAGVAFAAFALGIANMRRRRERTLLTCLTLVLLTFTVLSFTSIVNTIRYNDVASPGAAPYNGLLLRMPNWNALQQTAYRLLNDEYGGRYVVAPRAWYFGTAQGRPSFLHLTRGADGADVKGVCGLTAQEARVTGADRALTAGRWFRAGDRDAAIIPGGLAAALHIAPADVGRATLTFSGVPYRVIGIVDAARFEAVKDLDNEPLTPVDYTNLQNPGAPPGSGGAVGPQGYPHLDPGGVLILPYEPVMDMGGGLRSVAINLGDAGAVRAQLQSLMPRLDLDLYAGIAGRDHRFSATGATSSKGLVSVIIPLLIAGLIVLNTMLGSVYERVKEIAIFSSIGLSPANVAMLFFAEALVYGVISAVAGYLIGQGLAKLISALHVLPGLYLNFSSTSAELSIGLVIAVVLLSTIFPARKASQVATPAVDRAWRVPDPEGDVWGITLPFAVSGAQAGGINEFLAEWLGAYEEQSVGEVLARDVRTGRAPMARGDGYRLTARVWLAPFDLGVSQDMALDTAPTDLEGIYAVRLTLTRVSGDVSNWKRVNRRFLNAVRKQYLIWRTLTDADRARYLAAGASPGAPGDAPGDAPAGVLVGAGAA